MRLIIWLLYMDLIFYNIIDYSQTKQLILLGAAKESNPIVNWFIGINGNLDNILYLKLVVLAILGMLLFYNLHVKIKKQY